MKKVIVSLAMFMACIAMQAQTVMTFAKEKNQYIKDLNVFMTANKMEVCINTMNAFEKLAKEGKIPEAWFPQLSKTSGVMAERNMSAYTHFVPYLNAVMSAAKTAQPDVQFSAWSQFINDVMEAQKKGDNTGYLKTMEFSDVYFEQGALSHTAAKTWKVDAKTCTFNSEGLRPFVSFAVTNLYGIVKGDTVVIKQTSGDYYPLETKWEGKSGRVDWERASFDPNKVYCTFKNYTINVSNFNYVVDTVTFSHLDYFKTPLKGKLTDKMVSSADSGSISYPRFDSYDVGMTIKDIAPNVSYTGGFSLHGRKILGYGNAEQKGFLNFYARDGKTRVLSAKADIFSIKKGEELGADKAEVSIYFGTDSIYHPQLNVVYKILKREIRLLRGETGIGKAKFNDSYHNHEFQTDAIFWNLDSSVLNLKILSGAGQKPGIFESVNYFQKELIRKTQGFASYEPLSILKRLYEKNGSREVNAGEVAKAMDPNLKEGEAKSLFYGLVENGFILYNEAMSLITIKDKTLNYVLANAKKIDYDVIRIKSNPAAGNDYIDLKSSNIDLKGVFEVPISDSSYVFFRPKNSAISLQKDRNMEFDGLIYAGRMDLYGEKYKFQYAPFTVDMMKVDTMRINIPDGDKVDENGEPILKPLKSRIENMKGLLEIDAPINKSGRTKLPQFPRLYSREKAYIYYDDSTVAKGSYNRKTFYFELDPFKLDSLNNFSGNIINWKGKLSSGGIFPDIRDSVRIQKDESLGFKSETPPTGYDLYKGKGKYFGKFELNYNGLEGDGKVQHSTSEFVSHDMKFYPDSMLATTDSFTIAKTFEGVKTPSVKGYNDRILWKPNSDSMMVYMNNKEEPFKMYDDVQTSFRGDLLLTSKGLRGSGLLDWDEATLASRDFSFQTMNLAADTAALNIKSTGDKVTFKTPNVNAKVDFKTRIADFVSNQKNIPTDFSYNQYTTAINQFKWFMDEKILDFKAPPAGNGEYFTSTRPEQKGLNFLGKRATYSLITSIIRIEQVPEIRVADASVVPDSGVVIIEAEAKMNQLRNAVIIADTIKKIHKIVNATVDIYSKNELKAIGDYHYKTKGTDQILKFGDISCKKQMDGKRKKETESWRLIGRAAVDAKQNFVLYPGVKFNGDANLVSINPLLNFKGFAKLDLKHAKVNTSDFSINQDIIPDTLRLKYDTVKNSDGNLLTAGIHLNPTEGGSAMYATILAPKQDSKDITLFKATGVVSQSKTGEYVMGNEKKILEGATRGNLVKYDDAKGVVKAEGRMNLGANFGLIKTKASGSAEALLDSNKYSFNVTFGVNAQMGDKIQERLEFYMAGDNADMPDINYDTEKQKKAIYELTNDRDDKKLVQDFDAAPNFNKRPKGFDYNLVFSDINFVYDADDVSLRSVGKIGLAMVGKKVINKKLDGYIEIQYKGGADLFTIYLKTGTNDWVFLEYRPGTMGVLTSYDDINTSIGATPPDKRKVKGDKDRFYLYTLGSSLNKADFVDYMKDKANGINRPRFEPKLDIPIPGDSIMLNDTLNIQNYEEEPQQNIDIDLQQRLEQQQEINQLEEMKSNGENILSGPPPDRLQPKVEEKPEVPAVETPKEIAPTDVAPTEPIPLEVEPK